jgi:hypothetical protein
MISLDRGWKGTPFHKWVYSPSLMGSEIIPLEIYFLDHGGFCSLIRNLLLKCKILMGWMTHYYIIF